MLKCLKFNCFMLQSQKMKCLVLSRYPHSDPQGRKWKKRGTRDGNARYRQRNVQKSVMHVQSCCFAKINRLLFYRSRCRRRRRRRCLSFLLLLSACYVRFLDPYMNYKTTLRNTANLPFWWRQFWITVSNKTVGIVHVYKLGHQVLPHEDSTPHTTSSVA